VALDVLLLLADKGPRLVKLQALGTNAGEGSFKLIYKDAPAQQVPACPVPPPPNAQAGYKIDL
jgi:hypothetical protein